MRTLRELEGQSPQKRSERCNTIFAGASAFGAIAAGCLAAAALGVSGIALHQEKIGTLAQIMSARASIANVIHGGAMDGGAKYAIDKHDNALPFALEYAGARAVDFVVGFIDYMGYECLQKVSKGGPRSNLCETKLEELIDRARRQAVTSDRRALLGILTPVQQHPRKFLRDKTGK